MPGIGLAVIVTLSFVLAPLAVEAQQTKVSRIGLLANTTPAAATALLQVFRQSLRELGYVEGHNIAFEIRFEERRELLHVRAGELVRLGVAVIVASGTPATLAVKSATSTIPVVMMAVADPIQSGLVTSLARPGGNITGNAALTADLTAKQLELLREALPRSTVVSALWNLSNPSMLSLRNDSQAAARTLGFRIESIEIRGADDLERAFADLPQRRPDALLVPPDPELMLHLKRIADFALKNRLPTISLFGEFVAAGGLMSYGPSFPDLMRRSTRYIDRILKGAKPADLPVEQPTKFELVINMKTAKTLGLTIPQSVLLRADHVIE